MKCPCGDPLGNDGKGYALDGTRYCWPCFDRSASVAAERTPRAVAPETPTPESGEWREESPEAFERHLKVIAAGGEPTASDAPTTDTLLVSIIRALERYIVLPGDVEALTLALFVLHTWAIDAADTTPYIVVDSAERRSGKSRLLELLRELVRKPEPVANLSEAVLYRLIAEDEPTLLLDEVDAIFGQNTERTEALRGLLNAGNRRGTTVARCVPPKFEVKRFPVFSPKVLSGINEGRLPDTIRDRAITITMKRRLADEPIARMRPRKLAAEFGPLRGQCAQWADAYGPELADAEPDLPAELDDRAAEAWEPLFAIADLASAEWATAARSAAGHLSGGQLDDDEGTPGRRILAGIRTVWKDGSDRMTTAELVDALNGDDDLGFCRWSDGRGIDQYGVARYLKPYGIKPTQKRVAGSEKRHRGYDRDQFEDAWSRHLEPPDVTDVTDVTDPGGIETARPQNAIFGADS